jgi:hypothetical protein
MARCGYPAGVSIAQYLPVGFVAGRRNDVANDFNPAFMDPIQTLQIGWPRQFPHELLHLSQELP